MCNPATFPVRTRRNDSGHVSSPRRDQHRNSLLWRPVQVAHNHNLAQQRPTPAQHAQKRQKQGNQPHCSFVVVVSSVCFFCFTKTNLIVATPSCPPQQRQPLHNVAFAGAASNPVRDTHDDAKRQVLASRLDYQLAIHDGECLRCALDGFVAIDRARRGIATKPVKTRGQHRSANRPPTSRHTSCGAI